jgi:hypothetical protein
MIWVILLSLVSFFLVFFGCWLTMSRVRKFREESEANRVRAFAEMAQLAREKENAENADPRPGPRPGAL